MFHMRAQHAFDMKIIQQALEARPIVGHLPQAQKSPVVAIRSECAATASGIQSIFVVG